jgi:hypothetical protein
MLAGRDEESRFAIPFLLYPISSRDLTGLICFLMSEVPLHPLKVDHLRGPLSGHKYRGASLIRNCAPLGPYSRPMPRVLWWSWGWGVFL